MSTTLDLREATFIPPEADRHVEIVLNYWGYAFSMAAKDNVLEAPYVPPEVDAAQKVLDEKYPQVSKAVDKVIIARSLARDLHDY